MSLTWTYTPPAGAVKTVTVTFNTGDWVHVREVNAVFTANGEYDADATEIRVGEVGMGVQNKIITGTLVAPTNDDEQVANTP